MRIKTILGEVQSKIENPSPRFLFMFMGVALVALILFATGIREFSVLQQPSLTWSFLAIAVLLSLSVALSCWMFGQQAHSLSLSAALPFIAQRKKSWKA